MSPRVVSVNVARPAPVLVRDGVPVVTGILKRPVDGAVAVRPLGLEGDGVGDPRVHGGPRKAVYAYPSEHYEHWRSARPETALEYGDLGENLTLVGLLESEVRAGDRLAIGSAVLRVTQPRFPCRTLALRMRRPGFIDEFQRAGRPGFYLAVDRPGTLRAGDAVVVAPAGVPGPTIAEEFRARGNASTE